MIVETGRFGQITIGDEEQIEVPQGLIGFPEHRKFCLVDSGDDTFIIWLQSLESPDLAFALLEPKIFRPDYSVRLSAAELRELQLENVNQSAVFSILTIPEDVAQMTANLKAPLVINLKARTARQVVLQENEYTIKHPMFQSLRAHIVTMESQRRLGRGAAVADGTGATVNPIAIRDIPPSLTVKPLQA